MPTSQRTNFAIEFQNLPAAGAFIPDPTPIPVDQGNQVTFFLGYASGGAAGAVKYIIEESFDKIIWCQNAVVQETAVVPGADCSVLTQRANFIYQSTSIGGVREDFMSPTFTVVGLWIRIRAAETGNIGAPGAFGAVCYVREPM